MDTGKPCGDSAVGVQAVNSQSHPKSDSLTDPATKPLHFSKSRSPSPPPSSDSLSSLHRVTDMLKEKVICNISGSGDAAGSADRTSPTPGDSASHRKSPYLADPSPGKSVHGGCIQKMENCFPPLGAHRMSMLLDPDRYHHTESSNVLRGILQGKERGIVTGNNILEQESRAKRFNDMYGCLPPENDIKNGSIGDNSDVDSFRSRSPGDCSYDDSDPDRRMNGVSDMDDIIGENKESYRDSYYEGNDEQNSNRSECGSPKDKKIHVENTVSSSVHSSPSGTFNIDAFTPPERRPKRKQYIPQQHGLVDHTSSEPLSKVRRVEKEILQKQLKQMQQQLAIMQQRYFELFDQGEDISDMDCSAKEAIGERLKSGEKSFNQFGPLTVDFDPSHFIKQASNLVHEQEMISKCQTSPLSGKTPSDIAHLTRMLKDEITHGVGTLVDTAVAKYVGKNQKHSPQSSSSVITSTPVPSVAKPKKERPISPENHELSKNKSPCPGIFHSNNNNNNNVKNLATIKVSQSHSSLSASNHIHERLTTPKPPRTKVTDKISHPFFDFHPKPFGDLARAHPALFPPPPYFTQIPHIQPLYAKEPEQTEALSLVLGTPSKKKRTKVTDTRLSPRAARALLQEGMGHGVNPYDSPKLHHNLSVSEGGFNSFIPMSLPTSVAIPNPSLQASDLMALYTHGEHQQMCADFARRGHSSPGSPGMGHGSLDSMHHQSMKNEDSFEHMMSDSYYDGSHHITTTLTPMHLRKAKLMFFYTRYPSSSILKIYFPDVKFNKNNTAQLVKWFSNFREFYYIQMEKYARQHIAEGVKNPEELSVSLDSELYRILNLHYNRNNQIEVPGTFLGVVQGTLREFFKSVYANKDTEQSWKKAIYKVIARMDDAIPEYFKSPNWMEQLNDP